MLKWLSEIFSWIFKFWSGLPDETKENIINIVVEAFDALLKSYYRDTKDDTIVGES